MVIYELYGLPGAGKTTVTTSVIKCLKDKGYKVAGYNDIYGSDEKKRLFWVKTLFHITEYRLYYYYWQLYRSGIKRDRGFLEKLVFYSHQLLKANREEKYEIMFLEEGLIQFISSLFYMERIPHTNNLDKIVEYLTKRLLIKPIFCSVNINLSLQRIKERPYKQIGRYSHSVGSAVLEEVLKYRVYNLNVISSFFPFYTNIDMTIPAEENANKLVSIIEQEI